MPNSPQASPGSQSGLGNMALPSFKAFSSPQRMCGRVWNVPVQQRSLTAGEQGLSNFVSDWTEPIKGPGIGSNHDTLLLDSPNPSPTSSPQAPPSSPSESGTLVLPSINAFSAPAYSLIEAGPSRGVRILLRGILFTLVALLMVLSGAIPSSML
jgi:hypothetical protein